MALRNVPKSYTFDQQRQEINSLGNDVGDITQLVSGLPNLVSAINQISLAGDDGGSLLSGVLPPTSADGANGDFYLDTATKQLYGPKASGAWPASTISISEQILSGVVAPLSNQGNLNYYYFNSVTKELYGPKLASGWGLPTSLGEAEYQNVLFVRPNGTDVISNVAPIGTFTPTNVTYNPATGICVFTVPAHGLNPSNYISIANNSVTFRCAMDGNNTLHTLPSESSTVTYNNKTIPIVSITPNTITVNVGASGPNQLFTPSAATYNPNTGQLVLTIGSHTLSIGEGVVIADNSLTFTCGSDGNATQHTYPRSTDPVANRSTLITAATATTITVNVGVSSETSAHIFVSAVADSVKHLPQSVHTFVSAAANSLSAYNPIVSKGTSPSRAFKTIKAAATAAAALDGNTTIRVSTGTYYEDNPIYLPKGTSIVGDNLRETIVIPKNEGRDVFWITSGCYVNYMVIEDNFLGGKGFLDIEAAGNRVLSASATQFKVSPGNTLSRVGDIYGDGANLIEFQKLTIIDSVIVDLLAQFPTLISNPDYNETVCRRDVGIIIDGVVADLRSGGNVKSVKNGESYLDINKSIIPGVSGEEIQLIYAFERVAHHAKQKILVMPAGFTAAGYPTITQDISGYPECAKVQNTIDTLVNIVISIIQKDDIPPYRPGPQFILIDQEWMKVVNFNKGTGEFIVSRGQPDPVTGVPTTAAKHITGAFVTQNAFTWRYAVAYPDQDGISGKGRINLTSGSSVITGNLQTRFTQEIYPGWKIRTTNYTTVTASSAAYIPTTGVLTITSNSHGFQNDDQIIIGKESLTFTCASDGNVTPFKYPRENDPACDQLLPVFDVTTDTFKVNVGISSETSTHTFVSAAENGIAKFVGSNIHTVTNISTDDTLTVSAPIAAGEAKLLTTYKIIPPKENIFLSPYTQNCSCISKIGKAFYNSITKSYDASKTRAGGLLADGNQLDSNSPLESMVVDAFTQVVFGSIGFHMKNDAYSQLVSVFQVFESIGVLCESGGYASITNSATNFGNEGLKAVGFSNNVLPIFASGQVSSIQNITKTGINQTPSNIISTTFTSAAGDTNVRATIEVSIVDIGKFERGQVISISNHVSTPTINAVSRIIDSVDAQNNKFSILLDIPWISSYATAFGASTGEIVIATGSVYTEITVTGYQAPPIPNFVIKVPGLGLDPNGNEQVVGEILNYAAGNNTKFTTDFPLTNSQVAGIANNASIQLFAPSTVNSSSHTFEYVGSGINYTAFPQNGGINRQSAESVEVNSGKCYVSATDQSGNFSVGPFFNVNLRSGKVTFNGSVALGVLDSLQLKGSPGVPIFRFSPDDTLGGALGAEHTVLPTQKAVKDYISKSSVLGNFIGLNKGTANIPGLIVQLDSTGKIDVSQLPAASQFTVYTIETDVDRLQAYIPVSTKTIVSNTDFTVTLNSVTNLRDGLILTGAGIPTNTRIAIGGIDVTTKVITVTQTLPTLTVGQTLPFIGDALKPGDIAVQKNELDGNPNTVVQTWILTALPATDADNWELLSLNQLDASAIISGIVSPSRLGTGVPNEDTYLSGISKYTPIVKGILQPTNSAIAVSGTSDVIKKTGQPKTIASATWSAGILTFNTSSNHLLNTDDYVEVDGINPDVFNGTYQVTVVDSDTFTVAKATNPGSYLAGGQATLGVMYESGYLEVDVNSAAYAIGQTSGSSSLGVARYNYNLFDINTQSVIDIKNKGITLGKIQNIAPRTLLGNIGNLPANPEEISIGIGVAAVTTFSVALATNRYTLIDKNISHSLGTLPDLQLVPGKEYVFELGDVTGHPFNIVTSPGVVGANLYTTGVTGNGNESNTKVLFTVPQNAPAFLYYQSGVDTLNFGIIKIVRVGDTLEVVDSTSSATITLDSFGLTAVNTVEYIIQIKNTVNPNWIHSSKLMVIHDGTDVYLNEYATLFSNKLLGSFNVDISGGNVRLRYTPAFDGNDYLNRLIIQKNYVIS